MQSLNRLWSSGCLGKIAILIGVAIVGSFACGGLIAGFGALVPDVPDTSVPPGEFPEEPETESATALESPTQAVIEPTQIVLAEADLAVFIVSSSLEGNLLDIAGDQLLAMENPKGSGVFVYVPETRFSGVERFIFWLVLGGTAYPLNGATKDVTPQLPWPREAAEEVWSQSQLDPFQATEAIEIVFGQ